MIGRSPLGFLWGLKDPVATTNVLDGLRELRPGGEMIELADVGHYPRRLKFPTRLPARPLGLLEGRPLK